MKPKPKKQRRFKFGQKVRTILGSNLIYGGHSFKLPQRERVCFIKISKRERAFVNPTSQYAMVSVDIRDLKIGWGRKKK